LSILAIIPARGGSKSIPRKNIYPIAGKPLIAYTIELALKSNLINRVIVSTDDSEIAQISEDCGAEVPFRRPIKLAQDESTDYETFKHALTWLKDNQNYIPEIVVHLRPTMPLRKVSTIDKAIKMFCADKQADSLKSISLANENPYKMWSIENSGFLKPIKSLPNVTESYNLPRQKLPRTYWQNGYVDIIRPNSTIDAGLMHGQVIQGFIVDELCIDIDYIDSIHKVDSLLKSQKKTTDRIDQHRFPS
jgi:CMP-N,N'-diacetyllegionaminic acid synthase